MHAGGGCERGRGKELVVQRPSGSAANPDKVEQGTGSPQKGNDALPFDLAAASD